MAVIQLASPDLYTEYSPEMLQDEIGRINRLKAKQIACGGDTWDNLMLRLTVLHILLKQSGTAPAVDDEPDLWLDLNMSTAQIREMGFYPPIFTRVFSNALLDAAQTGTLDGYFAALVIRDGWLSIASLERLMKNRHRFDRNLVALPKIEQGSLHFILEFVPAFRARESRRLAGSATGPR